MKRRIPLESITADSGPIIVRPIGERDLDSIVDIHAAAFPAAALTAFGREAVRRQYRWYMLGPHDSVCLGAWLGDRLAGFCFSGVFRGATGGFIRKNKSYLMGQALRRPWLLWSPIVRDRTRQALRLLNPLRKRAVPKPDVPWWDQYGILAIAVDPSEEGKGVGRALMAQAETRARESGVPRMTLSVHPANTRAIRFYEGLGWTKWKREENWSGEMRKILDTESK